MEEAGLQGPTMALPGLDGNEQRCWQLFLDSSMRMLATVNGSRQFSGTGRAAHEQRNVVAWGVAGGFAWWIGGRRQNQARFSSCTTVSLDTVPRGGREGLEPLTDQLPGLDELEQRCWQAFLESSTRLLEMLNRRLVDVHELTMFEFLVLDLLARANGGSARWATSPRRE